MRAVFRLLNWAMVVLLSFSSVSIADDAGSAPGGAILFSSIGPRSWDIFLFDAETREIRQLTDHPALDYNAAMSPDGQRIAFVSEREGNPELFVMSRDGSDVTRLTTSFSLDDHPTWSPDGKQIAFSSTREAVETVGQAWNAIYLMDADGANVRRVSPPNVTDYSPAWSPDGEWIACASGGGEPGGTDLYVMRPDGSERRRVITNGGWPSFSPDGDWIYFHRPADGATGWGVWRARLDGSDLERVTPEGIEVSTPHASPNGDYVVAAVLKDGRRQIVQFDLNADSSTQLSERNVDHWNPSSSNDGSVVFHCEAPGFTVPNVELWEAPPEFAVQLVRLGGAFPAVSPDGSRVALTAGNFGRLDVMNIDGSDRRTLFPSQPRHLFSLSWGRATKQLPERIAFSHGHSFQGHETVVNVETMTADGASHHQLTQDAANNAFPSFSPDGSQIVFRSGRDGNMNLYIMDSDGSNVRRLTEGDWTDTMADWSPSGDWIAFSSTRGENYEIWLIQPDGTGLKKLVGGNARHNHPHFSPNGEWIVFTSQRAGFSAEVISSLRQPQAYGELFAIKVDGTGLIRLTHNAFEEGTPDWAGIQISKPSRESLPGGQHEF